MKKFYRLFFTLIIWSGLFIRFYTLYVLGKENHNIGLYLNVYFSYFTIESNLLLGLLFILLTIKAFKNEKFSYPIIKGGIILYITITGLIYTIFLAKINPISNPLVQISTIIMHYITPPLAIIDWFIYEERKTYRYRYSLIWLIYPLFYFIYILIRGSIINIYPYPFIDLNLFNYSRIIINALFLTLSFLLLGCFYIFLNKRLK